MQAKELRGQNTLSYIKFYDQDETQAHIEDHMGAHGDMGAYMEVHNLEQMEAHGSISSKSHNLCPIKHETHGFVYLS